MRVKPLCRGLLAGAAALAVCVGLANRASAAPVAYTIDSTMSSLTLVVTALPVTPQAPGADTTALGGTLSADLTAGVLTFSGGSFIDALPNPVALLLPATAFNLAGKFGPSPAALAPGFIIGTEDNFGVVSAAFGPIAVRDVAWDILAGTVMDAAVPAGMSGINTAGSLDNLGIDTTPSIVGSGWVQTTLLPASLTTVGNVETLVLPLKFTTSTTVSTGTIVATRMVPEPSTILLAGFGALGIAVVAWRKRKPTQ